MDYIVKYISNPMAVGTYNFNFMVDLSNLKKFFLNLAEQIKEKRSAVSPSFVLDVIASRRLEEMAKESQLPKSENAFERIMDALGFYSLSENCPNEIRQMLGGVMITSSGDVIRRKRLFERFSTVNSFKSKRCGLG